MPLAIRAEKLVKTFGAFTAVGGIDLEIPAGECFGMLGPNGAGKTTTTEILEGLQTATSGTVEILGGSWASEAKTLRTKIGVALQETKLPDRYTVTETLDLFRSFYPGGRSSEELLRLLQLEEKKKTWNMHLSGGQRQRLALGCALVGDPDVLFLDEPTTGLDPQTRRALWNLVLALRAQGKTIFLTTHYMDEAERLCDRVAVMDQGTIICIGAPKQLIAALPGAHVIELASERALDVTALAALPGVKAVREEAESVSLTVDELHVSLPAVLAQAGPVTRLSTHSATLEDVFVSLTGRSLRDA
jgi:ABC-2 type transport system ATP-binding protein